MKLVVCTLNRGLGFSVGGSPRTTARSSSSPIPAVIMRTRWSMALPAFLRKSWKFKDFSIEPPQCRLSAHDWKTRGDYALGAPLVLSPVFTCIIASTGTPSQSIGPAVGPASTSPVCELIALTANLSSERGAGPWLYCPSAVNCEPWQGQINLPSWLFRLNRQPRWVHTLYNAT